ncbi:MAG: hypothetical protein GWP91_13600 [Rhodobacterales bacterium]|nr:hypothetical protein [Rhodobacterales bacterium]
MEQDDISTRLIQKIPWLPPVAHVDLLPLEDIAEGTMCFVETDGEEEIWFYVEGIWTRRDIL